MRRAHVKLAGIVALALVLRLAGLGDRLSHDEGYSWLVASAPSLDVFLDRIAHFENTPLLFYTLLVPLPHDDEAWLRLPALVAGVAAVPALYAAVRALVDERAALLAALGLAVAPYAVSFSNYSRGHMLATFLLTLALWGAARVATGGGRRWWALYALGGAAAMYSEYYAGLFLVALLAGLLALRRLPSKEVLGFGALPLILFLPWLNQLGRSVDALDRTKVAPSVSETGLEGVRLALGPLFFGEHGTPEGGLRTLQALAVLGALALATVWLWRRGPRAAAWLLGGTTWIVLALHFVVGVFGPDLFAQRYLTPVLPPAIGLLACAVALIPWRRAVLLAATGLLALAVAVFIVRHDREIEVDGDRVAEIVGDGPHRTVLTNSGPMAWYLRDFDARLDKPLGLGEGEEARCGAGCVVVDDTRFGGARSGPGQIVRVDSVEIRYPPDR